MHTDDNPEAEHIFNTSNTVKNMNYKTPCTVEAGGKPHISDAAGYQYDQVIHHKMGQNRTKALGITSVGVGESN